MWPNEVPASRKSRLGYVCVGTEPKYRSAVANDREVAENGVAVGWVGAIEIFLEIGRAIAIGVNGCGVGQAAKESRLPGIGHAIGIVSHYDSSPDAPGAADDGLGVAVSLEAARVLAARTDRRYTLFILVTDGEEAGLMGAAGLASERDVMDRLQAYINVEATGNDGTAVLFETGPANGWILKPWSRRAPRPRGGSWALELYRRLPNDTDFSIFKRHDIPGLNFAAVDDSYAYHTARDTPDRVTDRALLHTGENVVETAIALDAVDVRARDALFQSTYFDIGRTVAAGPT